MRRLRRRQKTESDESESDEESEDSATKRRRIAREWDLAVPYVDPKVEKKRKKELAMLAASAAKADIESAAAYRKLEDAAKEERRKELAMHAATAAKADIESAAAYRELKDAAKKAHEATAAAVNNVAPLGEERGPHADRDDIIAAERNKENKWRLSAALANLAPLSLDDGNECDKCDATAASLQQAQRAAAALQKSVYELEYDLAAADVKSANLEAENRALRETITRLTEDRSQHQSSSPKK